MDRILNIWRVIRKHKYLISIVVFVIIIGFLDENSLVRRMQYGYEIRELTKEIERNRALYEESTRRLHELSTNPDAIEHIAREQYMMKKDDEDIYVFEVK